MARGRIKTETAIVWGAAGLGVYMFWKHREAIATGATERGLSMVQQDPRGAVDASMLAYQLGLRPSDFVAGFDGYGACEECSPTYEGYGQWNTMNDHQWGQFGAFSARQTKADVRQARQGIQKAIKTINKANPIHSKIRSLTRAGWFKGGKGKGAGWRTLIPFKKKVRKAEIKLWKKVQAAKSKMKSTDKKLADLQKQLGRLPPGLGTMDGYGKMSIGDYAQEAGPGKVALVAASTVAPFTLYPWMLKKWKPELGYGSRVLLSVAASMVIGPVVGIVRRAIVNRNSSA